MPKNLPTMWALALTILGSQWTVTLGMPTTYSGNVAGQPKLAKNSEHFAGEAQVLAAACHALYYPGANQVKMATSSGIILSHDPLYVNKFLEIEIRLLYTPPHTMEHEFECQWWIPYSCWLLTDSIHTISQHKLMLMYIVSFPFLLLWIMVLFLY